MRPSRGATRECCALCLQKRELRLSHIIPEFFYKALALYGEKHRFYAYSTVSDEPVSRPQQKGFREYLLCGECEGRLNRWETYARKVIFGGVALDCAMDPKGNSLADGVDYATFKLFSMSMLWRMSVSSREEFARVELGVHAETMRERLFANEPGMHWDYGFTILYPPDADAEEILSRTMVQPERLRFKSHLFYRLSLGMTFWLFPVSGEMAKLEADGWHFSLSENGPLIFYNGGSPPVEYTYRLAAELSKAESARKKRDEWSAQEIRMEVVIPLVVLLGIYWLTWRHEYRNSEPEF